MPRRQAYTSKKPPEGRDVSSSSLRSSSKRLRPHAAKSPSRKAVQPDAPPLDSSYKATAIQKMSEKMDVWTIWYAARHGKILRIRSILDRRAVSSINVQEHRTKWSALHFACRYGHTEVVQLLLDRGADPALLDHTGNTPLHLSAGWGNLRGTVLLLEAGAFADHRNNSRKSPLDVARTLARTEQLRVLESWQPLGLSFEELLARRESLLAADPVAQRVVALTQLEDELTEETDALVRHELHALHAKLRLHGDTHAGLLITLDRLTERYRSTGRLAKALETAERGMSLTEALYGQSHLQTLTWLNNTAEILWLLGRLNESEDHFAQAHRGFVEQLGDSDLSTLRVLENLTLVCSQLGRLEDTERLLRELLRLLSAVYDDGSNERVLNFTMQLGSVVLAQRRTNEALEIFTTCLYLTETVYGHDHPQVATCHDQMGRCWFLLGDMEQAETAFFRSMQLISSTNAALSLMERQRLHNNLAVVAIAKRSHAAVVRKLQEEYQLDTGDISIPAT